MTDKTIIKLDLTTIEHITDAVVIKKVKQTAGIVYLHGMIDSKDSDFFLMSGRDELMVMDIKNNLLTEIAATWHGLD